MKSIMTLTILSVLLLVGCHQNIAREDNTNPSGLAHTNQTEVEQKSGQEIAEHLTELASTIPEVHDATAIVVGELAIVGIDVNEKLDRSDVGTIKYTVAEALKSDPYGANAFVAADVDTVTRLQEMRAKIDAGYPVAGVMNELAGIVGRLMPVTPGSEHKKEDPQPTDANDERLSNHQKKELEDIQEEQGKRDMEIEDRPRRKQTEDNIPEQGTLKNVDELERSRD